MKLPSMKSATAALVATIVMTAATLISATSAQAAGIDANQSVTVQFADLNLDSVAGNQALYRRLSHAAEEVCGDDSSAVALYERRDIEQCKQVAIENAVAQVARPQLIDLYDRRFPREPLSKALASEPYVAVEKVYFAHVDGSVTEVVMLAVHR